MHEIITLEEIDGLKLRQGLRVELWSNSWVYQVVCDTLGLYAYGKNDFDAMQNFKKKFLSVCEAYKNGELAKQDEDLAQKLKPYLEG